MNNPWPEGWKHLHLEETSSTMIDLKNPPYCEDNSPVLLLTTDYQTAGRGQRGTHWEARRGEDLLFGLRFHPAGVRADHQFLLSEVQALSVAETLDEFVGGIRVKWPNDIYWLDRKICGMLLEHTLAGSCIETTITGVGLNVNQDFFESDAPNPISLCQITGYHYDCNDIMHRIALRFSHLYSRLLLKGEGNIHRRYLRRLYRRDGLFHRFSDAQGSFQARIVTVLPDGRLVLRDEQDRRRIYAFKEVKYL